MAALVANAPQSPLMTTPSASIDYAAAAANEPKIYISTAKLELKQANREAFEWHTKVITPDEQEPQLEQPVQKQTTTEAEALPAQVLSVNKNLYTPADTYAEAKNMSTMMDKFMDTERYHSQLNQSVNHALLNRQQQNNSTNV